MHSDSADQLYPELFSAGTEQKAVGRVPRNLGEYDRCLAWNRDALLFLLFHSSIYRIYQRRTSPWGNIFLLISSPMVDLASLLLLTGIFGWEIAVAYVIVGLIIAVVGGTLIEKFHMEKYVESFIKNASLVEIESPTLTQKERVIYAKDQTFSTFKKVFPYILIGVGIGAVIHNWIPETWIENVLGSNNPFGVILATIVGIPMYGDIFGTIPVAEALLSKGAQLGTILSFMMAVTTLSLPSLIMLKKAVKAKLLAVFIGICTIGIMIVGYLFNAFEYLFI